MSVPFTFLRPSLVLDLDCGPYPSDAKVAHKSSRSASFDPMSCSIKILHFDPHRPNRDQGQAASNNENFALVLGIFLGIGFSLGFRVGPGYVLNPILLEVFVSLCRCVHG